MLVVSRGLAPLSLVRQQVAPPLHLPLVRLLLKELAMAKSRIPEQLVVLPPAILALLRTTDKRLSKAPASPLPTDKHPRELQVCRLPSRGLKVPPDSRFHNKVNKLDNKRDSSRDSRMDNRRHQMVVTRTMATNSREPRVRLQDSSLKARRKTAVPSNRQATVRLQAKHLRVRPRPEVTSPNRQVMVLDNSPRAATVATTTTTTTEH